MKDLEENIAQGVKAFAQYNRTKKRIMQMNDPLGARVILNLVPLCIHINHASLPGYNDDDCPCGIKCVGITPAGLKDLEPVFSTRIKLGEVKNLVPRQREIEGLFTIGSVGSLGQTRDSDYDIWVVVDFEITGKQRLKLLERKLKLLQRWITGQYIIEVHFFLMDIKNIRQNNFGMVSQEGSGSALKSILKEEFYRTMTLIGGRAPLWWVTPAGSGNDAYEAAEAILQSHSGKDAERFIDMGNITAVPNDELLGAALWQMHKALNDPLKSVLKMALTATYLEYSNGSRLLCDEVKLRVMEARQGEVVDPYAEVLRRVEDYYFEKGDEKIVDLLRKCFYLKASPNITKGDLIRIDSHEKTAMMVDVVKKWGWSIGYFHDLNRFQDWHVDKYRAFGDELHDYLKRTTVLLIRRAKTFLPDSHLERDIEIEILRRRIEAFYVSKEGKIDPEKRVKKKEPAYEEIFFSFKNRKWLIHDVYTGRGKARPIMTADRVVKILAWLVYNKRINASTAFHMVPNASRTALSDIQTLLRELDSLIPDAGAIGLDRDSLMEKKHIKQIVVVGNMESPDMYATIQDVDVLYINSWDEFFCVHMLPQELKPWMRKNRTPETKISIWLPRECKSIHLVNTLYSLFF